MTTENTDAATRILTKTIRKLAEQLAEADEQEGRAHRKRMGAEGELMDARAKLDPNGAHTFPSYLFTLPAQTPPPRETVVQLAEKRMSELAEERVRRKSAEEGRTLAADRMVDLEERIEKALASLEGTGSAVARVHAARRILRGEGVDETAAEPDVMDESDKRPRIDSDGDCWWWTEGKGWTYRRGMWGTLAAACRDCEIAFVGWADR